MNKAFVRPVEQESSDTCMKNFVTATHTKPLWAINLMKCKETCTMLYIYIPKERSKTPKKLKP